MQRLVSVLLAALILGSVLQPHPVAAQSAGRPVDLGEILETLGRMAELYRSQALSFTAVEQINVTRYLSQDRVGDRNSFRFDYFYVFQEPSTREARAVLAAGLRDFRAEIASRGEESEPVDLMARGIPAAISRAYSWMFIFQRGLRDTFVFTLERDDEAMGRDAWVIGFAPNAPFLVDFNDWFGRVWIDKENFQLLRAEAAKSPDYVRRQDPRIPEAERRPTARIAGGGNGLTGNDLGGVVPENEILFAHTVAEFGEVKNGLRFPSKTELVAAYLDIGNGAEASYRAALDELLERGIRRDRLFRIEQRYDDYRFFGVHTEQQVDDLLRAVRDRQ